MSVLKILFSASSAALIMIGSITIAGCKHGYTVDGKPTTQYSVKNPDGTEGMTITRYQTPTTNESRRLISPIQPANDRPMLQGKLPLTYLVDSDMTLTVADPNGQIIASAPFKSGSILTVTTRGVFSGRNKIGTVNEPAGVFSIYYVPPRNFVEETTQVPSGENPSQ